MQQLHREVLPVLESERGKRQNDDPAAFEQVKRGEKTIPEVKRQLVEADAGER